jgi:RND family efflux transporter MFP subunit
MKAAHLILAIAVALPLAACTRGNTQEAGAAARAVSVAPLATLTTDGSLHAMGLLTPKEEARMSFKVGGVVESIKVEEGQHVKAGQVLALLKQTEIGASLEQARQSSEKARRDLERGKALLADGVATEENVQDLTTAYHVARAAESSVEFNAAHARIEAGSDGVVLRKLAEANEVVQAGQTVLVLGGAKRGWVIRVGLADRDVVRLHLGDEARVEFDAWPGKSFAGKVSNISSAADTATGTFMVEVQVEPGSAGFAQGLVAKVALKLTGGEQVQAIPVQALLEANDREAGVFVLNADGKSVRRVTIEIGGMSNGMVSVRGGLPSDAQVIVEGAAFLESGDAVRVASR